MILKEITLLGKEEYAKYKSLVPKTSWWWLKTPASDDLVYTSNCGDTLLSDFYCADAIGGVRPVCVFILELTDFLFWHKTEKLVGSKIKYGKYDWTIVDIKNGELCTLCDECIAKHHFDLQTNIWGNSELKRWLDTDGLKSLTN